MNNMQKYTLLLFFFAVGIGCSYGYTDFATGNNIFYIVFYFLNVGFSLPNTFWFGSLFGNIISVATFLVIPPFFSASAIGIGFLIGYTAKKNMVHFSKSDALIILAIYLLIISTAWDTVYMYLVFTYWCGIMITDTVLWLPFVNGGINFSWHFGVWFIFIRSILIILLAYHVLVKFGGVQVGKYYGRR